MHRTTATAAAVLLLAVLTAGCSSEDGGGDQKPKPTATATETTEPALSEEEARTACVDAWADALLENADLGVDQEPAECEGLPADDRLDRYMEGMQQRNEINRG